MATQKSTSTKQPARARPVRKTTPDRIETAASPATTSEAPEKAREQMIAEAAYYRAEKRGFEAGYELDDWLAAEADIAIAVGEAPRSVELH